MKPEKKTYKRRIVGFGFLLFTQFITFSRNRVAKYHQGLGDVDAQIFRDSHANLGLTARIPLRRFASSPCACSTRSYFFQIPD